MADIRESGLPKKTYYEHILLSDWLNDQLGVISGHLVHGKRYFSAESFMYTLDVTIRGLNLNLFLNKANGKPIKFELNKKDLQIVNNIWNTNTFVGVFRDNRKPTKILQLKYYTSVYDLEKDKKEGIIPSELEIKPSLKNMKPKRHVLTNVIWREIGEKVPMKYAWEGYTLEDLYLLAGFRIEYNKFDTRPKFRSLDQLKEKKYTTRFVSKRYFETTMDLLFSYWMPARNNLYLQMKEITKICIGGNKTDDDTIHLNETIEPE